MDIITKEERDKLLDERMAEMRIRNEKAKQRFAEIEAEKKALGDAAAPPPAVSKDWKIPEYKEEWGDRNTTSHEETSSKKLDSRHGAIWPGDNPDVETPRHSKPPLKSGRGRGNTPRSGRGRGRRGGHSHSSPGMASPISADGGGVNGWDESVPPLLPSSSPEGPKPQISHGSSNAPQNSEDWHAAVASLTPSNRGGFKSPGSGRIPPKSHDQSYDAIRKQNAASYELDMKNQQGFNDGGNFLRDTSRTNQDNRRGGRGGFRHHNNYGGGENIDLRDKIRQDRQRNLANQKEFNPAVHMTGKERVEHSKWKGERDRWDQQRVERAKNSQGGWKREWDSSKPTSNNEEPPEEYNIYKEIDNKKHSPKDTQGMRGVSSSRGRPPRGRGRGSNRQRKLSQGSTDPQRKVEQSESQLKVTISSPVTTDQLKSPNFTQNSPVSTGSKIRPSSNKKSAPSANQHSPQKQQPSEKLSADQIQPSAEGARAKDYDPRALPPSGARAKDRGQRRRQGGRSGGGGNTAYPTNPANRTQASGAAKSADGKGAAKADSTAADKKKKQLGVKNEEQLEDEEGWVDCDDPVSTDEETTPQVPTTPVSSTPKAPTTTTPPVSSAKPELKINIGHSHSSEEIFDVMKTPEGGRQRLDWAQEMESPVTSPEKPVFEAL
ncbi:CCDC9 [Bugula neritina]|uniref:CCDC9 n=1 Tax=Bugula neritina TaxID=10212 RepID=A0A7J7JB87_BUGNE|nr:CCDC9 [Bugula neritina]